MADCYCFLCGGNAEVSQILDIDLARMFSAASEKLPDPAVMAKLRFGAHDKLFQRDLCLIGPFDDSNNVLFDPLQIDPDAIYSIDARTVRVLDDVSPGEEHDYATVKHRPTGRDYAISGNTYPFVHKGCLRILHDALAAEGYEYPERAFWAVVRHMNIDSHAITGIEGVNYGREIEMTHDDEVVRPLANFLEAYQCKDTLPKQLVQELEAGQLSQALVYQYWLGVGAMWVHVSPHWFPYQQTFANPFALCLLPPQSAAHSRLEQLPVELLVMISEELDCFSDIALLLLVSKTVRHMLIPHMDAIVKELAPQWMIPPSNELAVIERAAHAQGRGFPWLKYAHTCRFISPSMRNRWRIFGICDQIAGFAQDLSDEELGQTPDSDRDEDMDVDDAMTD
ncbi:hypothetical protein EXIGLDRAFT_750792 [Exidia glandulosa HHB12029]|uniref:F-box domain-containing protein n=1 Tax=Exidia glandulosa HHB12029 TaxID=1314781 RepID=A0A165G978_EXIGL|nr:hypothetical protein EXIGLDRAFT_750792 [Exidia glandulosa HHB12029]